MLADDPAPVDLTIQSDERSRRDAVSDITAGPVDSSGYGLGGFETLRSDENTADSTFRRCSPTVVSERPVSALEFVPGIVWFLAKVWSVFLLTQWARSAIPRLRIDQVLTVGWKGLLVLAFANLLLTAVVVGLIA